MIFTLVLLMLNLFLLPFILRLNIDNEKEQVLPVASTTINNNDLGKFLLKEMDIINRIQNQYGAEYIKLNNNDLELSIKSSSSDADTMIKNINEIIDIHILNLLDNSTYINIKGRAK